MSRQQPEKYLQPE